ncbi:MAG: DUF6263 family protein [Bacteroidota bacterium]
MSCKQSNNKQPDLSFNPEPSVLYKLSVTRINNLQWIYQDKPQQAVDSSLINYTFQLIRTTDTAFLLKFTFGNFRKKTNQYKVDTETGIAAFTAVNTNPLLLYDYLLHFAKEQSVTVWMNTKGRSIQVNGVERLVDSIAKISGEPENITRQFLEDFISDDVIKDELNKIFCFIPGKPKNPRQSWVENIILMAKAPVKWSTSFTLDSMRNDTADISCNSFMSARQGGDGRTYMKGKLTGNIKASYTSGIPFSWIASSETTTTTDSYDIITRQFLKVSIVAEKP